MLIKYAAICELKRENNVEIRLDRKRLSYQIFYHCRKSTSLRYINEIYPLFCFFTIIKFVIWGKKKRFTRILKIVVFR